MKPDFALSLSVDGIKLLCRAEGGWQSLGEVPLQHADLGSALGKLSDAAVELLAEGEVAHCKLILPNDQIKYLKLDVTEQDPETTAAAALEQATPYRLDELAFDYETAGDKLYVAAVAKDTLEEAESFALEYGFSPVCFVAIPGSSDFIGEPFFGETKNASHGLDGQVAQPDDAAIVILDDDDEIAFAPITATPAQSAAEPEVPVSFATRRTLSAKPDDALEDPPAVSLPGATRGDPSDATAEDAAEKSVLSQQAPRFDPTAIVAGLKQRPEASGKERARGISRSQEAPTLVASADEPPPKAPTPTRAAIGLGAATQDTQARSRPLIVILLAILLLFMAGVAAWAALFTEDGVAGLFQRNEVEQIPLIAQQPGDGTISETVLASADPSITSDELLDTAEIEADDLREGILLDPVLEALPDRPLGDAFYAATGIWDRPPTQPSVPATENSESIYLGSFEVEQQTHDAIALPLVASLAPDTLIAPQYNPVAAGTTFEFDDRGLVLASAEGAITPEGIMVFSGKPAVVPASLPQRSAEVIVEEPTVAPELLQLASIRPQVRPSDLIEQNERVNLGGSTRSELALFRPRLRPAGLAPEPVAEPAVVAIDPAAIQDATDQAVLASLRPQARPSNFARTVERTQEQLAAVAVPEASVAAPSIPTTASVARSATQTNAINLRKVNLIGVYGTSNDRRALVRLASGRYKKVKVGDRIDGGQVAAIGDSELRYVKGNRSVVLTMPKG